MEHPFLGEEADIVLDFALGQIQYALGACIDEEVRLELEKYLKIALVIANSRSLMVTALESFHLSMSVQLNFEVSSSLDVLTWVPSHLESASSDLNVSPTY